MAITYQQQRRPLTAVEVRDDDPLSTRFYNRLAHNINNLKLYVTRPMLVMQHWPNGMLFTNAAPRYPEWPLLHFHEGFTSIRFVIGWERTAGAGTLTARLYARETLQTATPATSDYSAAVTKASNAHEFTASRIQPAPRYTNPHVHLFLSLTVPGGTQGTVYTFKAWCE